ncbi:MAG: SDR family oxidoreductase [Alphaproteobacteria bacterium]|jgi:NADP-dependent 3-hydroxy acid dehydrogenase YdfG
MAKRDLAGKVVWVTGGGSGIGQGAAEALATAGVTVLISGRRLEPIQQTVRAIQANGGQAEAIQLDVADADAVNDVAASIEAKHGRLDILLNSAGVNTADRRFGNMSAADFKTVVDVNLNGTFHCIQAALPMLRQAGDGLVINISSWAGNHINYLTGPAYTASKYAVGGMTEILNIEEFQNGVRGTVVYPAEVATPILDSRPIKVSDEDKALMAQPEDLGDVVLFLAELPARVCINEITVSPTHNRIYLGGPGVVTPRKGSNDAW